MATITLMVTAWVVLTAPGLAQERDSLAGWRDAARAPDRAPGEGEGPFSRLVIRGATVIDGTGDAPSGPVDLVIEKNRIVEVTGVGVPGVPIDPRTRPKAGEREIDAHGMYVLPGFVDLHAHIGGDRQGVPAEYIYKLWLAHGVTTVREAFATRLEWSLREQARSARNQIVAPRIFVYLSDGAQSETPAVTTPESARAFVQWVAKKGGDGLKLGAHHRELTAALIDEAKKQGLGTQAHLGQMGPGMNALDAARLGLGTLEHWYGLPEALFTDRAVQDFPPDYNYSDEQHRFGQAGRLWRQAAPPGSAKWNAVMEELLALKFALDPTLAIYEASRDLMRAQRAEWHDRYTMPSLWRFFQPRRGVHGSYWFDWTTADEIAWKENYRLWMQFLNEYKNRGGRVCTGSDSGFIYQVYGFGYIRELEMLQEAGFHPLEVIRAATLCGAEVLHEPKGKRVEFGVVRPGLLADLVVVAENPLRNLKVLYGTGHLKLNDETRKPERVGGVKYTIKDGIVYEARKLLGDVASMVEAAKRKEAVTAAATPAAAAAPAE